MLKLETLFCGEFEKRDASRHDKTVPYYIFAIALEGRYELFAGEEYADCAEGEAFFTAPNVPLRIFHHLNPDSGRMHVRYLHFRLVDERGLDLFAFRKVPLRIDRETAERIDRHVAELCRLPKEKGTVERIREMREAFAAISILETLLPPPTRAFPSSRPGCWSAWSGSRGRRALRSPRPNSTGVRGCRAPDFTANSASLPG